MRGHKVYHPSLILVLASLLTIPAAMAEIRISEIMVAGQSIIQDEDGAYSDWIEIENTGGEPVSLTGWHLTDRVDRPKEWTFPAVSLPGGGHVVVFTSGKDRATSGSELHTNFALRSGGEWLGLTNAAGTIVHALEYPVQIPDLSFDGTHFLEHPTPGAANDGTLVLITNSPQFSEPHGFKTEAFELTLTCATANATIRYTLDGTEPAESSFLFERPISIARTTVVRAAAFASGLRRSPLVTRTYLFINDVVQQSPAGKAPKGFPKTWGANHVDYGMDPRITQRPPYRQTIKNDLQTIPSLSIVMDPADLFDSATGIYANPSKRGTEWERSMSIELIQPNGEPGFQINGGLRIRGGASRAEDNPKHSFRVLFRGEYGAPELKFPLFGPGGAERTQKFDIRCEQLVAWHFFVDPQADFIRDIYGRDTQGALGQPHKRGDFHHLYINGQYWGLYQTDERISAEYAAEYFGGSEDDYDIVKFDVDSDFGTGFIDGTFGAWRRLFDAGSAGFEDNAAYFKVQGRHPDGTRNPEYERLLDVDNLIDYMLAGIFITADDSPPSFGTQNNWYGVRSRKDEFGFRFFAHDWEISMSNAEDNRVGPPPAGNPFESQSPQTVNPWHYWEALRFNLEFRLRVADRAQKVLLNDGPLTREAAKARWQNRMDEIDRAIVGESARWGDARGRGNSGPFLSDPRVGALAAAGRAAGRGEPIVSGDPVTGLPPSSDAASTKRVKPFTREDWFKAANGRVLNGYLDVRTQFMLQHLIEGGLYPTVPAPVLTPHGGPLAAGQLVTVTSPQADPGPPLPAGETYYTLDGSDPRKVGGAISGTAQHYANPFALAKAAIVKTRVLRDGLWSALVEVEFEPDVDLAPLRVTEIFYNPSFSGAPGTDEAEFLELKNTGLLPLDLSGLHFTAGIEYTFPPGTILNSGEFVVLVRNAAAFNSAHPGFDPATVAHFGVFNGRLSDDGEVLTLSTASGARVFSLEYDDDAPWPRAADGFGYSATYGGEGDSDDGNNWHVSSISGGTPGADDQRPIFPQVVVNEILTRSSTTLDAIELHNLDDSPADISGWLISHEPSVPEKFRIPPATVIPAGGYLVFDAAQLGFTFNGARDEVWLFSANAGSPPSGYVHDWSFGAAEEGRSFGREVNSLGEEYLVAQKETTLGAPNAGPVNPPVFISEIHYAPLPGGDEFVELRNNGLILANLGSARIDGLNFALPPDASLPQGGTLLVVTIDPAAFREKYRVSAEVKIFGPAAGSLQDNGENVALELPVTVDGIEGFREIDRVRYDDRRPWPVAAAGLGASLQRLTSTTGVLYGNEPRSWLGGSPTPGAINAVNAPPQVRLTHPRGGLVVRPPANVLLTADSSDSDGGVEKVEFLVDQIVVGEDTETPYEFEWIPTPGLHDLSARAVDFGQVSSESDFVTISVDAPANGAGLGLRGEYFDNADLAGAPVAVRNDPQINFDWAEVGPIEGVSREGFSVRWTGSVLPRTSGEHTIAVGVTGAVRLYINEELVIDQWQEATNPFLEFHQVNANLVAGQPASLRLEYADRDGFANIVLQWIEPGDFLNPLIPATQLVLPDQDLTALGIAMDGQLPPRRVGRPFSTDLVAVNGPRPYSWTLVGGALPSGLILNAAGTLSGSPTEAGVFRFRFQVSDSDSAIAQRDFTLQVVDDSGARPRVEIITPEPGASFGDGKVTLAGTASSRRGIAMVRYSLNSGPWHVLPGRENWRVRLDALRGLVGGANNVSVVAVDVDGKESSEVHRRFRRVIQRPLTVLIQGAGSVTPEFLGTTSRTVGKRYKIDATSAPGWVFREWLGPFPPNPHLVFNMEEGLVITAVFEPNPFLEANGAYAGFIGETQEDHAARGTIALSLSKTGAFTGTLRFAGQAASLKGEFGTFRQFSKIINLGGDVGSVSVNLEFLPDSKTIGVLIQNIFGELGFSESAGTAERSTWGSANPCPQAGAYTIALPLPAPPAPQGDGSARISIARKGGVRLVGKLGDGSAWTASARVTDHGIVSLYTPLYRGSGSISGPLTFVTGSVTEGTGQLFWSRPNEFSVLLNAVANRAGSPAAKH